MNYKKFCRIVDNPRHIPFVHNYCDDWCKHCPLTLRCSVFAFYQVQEKDQQPHNKANEFLWSRLESLQPIANDLLAKHADHPGIPVSKNPRFNKVAERTLRKSTLGAAAKRYMEFAHQFVTENEKRFPTFASLTNIPIAPAEIIDIIAFYHLFIIEKEEAFPASPPPADAPITFAEAFDIIAFFHLFINAKISRALHREALDEELEYGPELADIHSDHNGSAKIALIAIDRSILAWAALSQLPAILTLHRLRKNLEKHFPDARAFQRPGFDTLRFK